MLIESEPNASDIERIVLFFLLLGDRDLYFKVTNFYSLVEEHHPLSNFQS